MPYLVLALAVLFGGAVVLMLMSAVVTALSPLLALAGAGTALVTAALTLFGRGPERPVLVTPDQVVGGTAGMRAQHGPFPRDWAWPGYLVVQWRRDLMAILRGWGGLVARGWRWAFVRGQLGAQRWFRVGLVVFLGPPFLFGGALGAFQGLLFGAVVLLLGWIGWGAAIGVMRGYDNTVRGLRRASASCPTCYHVMSVPAYRCNGCQTVHHDIRPGLLGAIRRRCGCGERLPTTVLRASRHLEGRCQRCDRPLRGGSGAVTDIRVPVFGPVSAGKTRLVHAGLVTLRDLAAAEGVRTDFVDDSSRQAFQHGEQLISSGADTTKTPAGQLPAAITVQLVKSRGQALLHLFDAAGEFFLDREDNSELEFLDHAGGLVFVIDPFTIGWVRDQLGGHLESRLAEAHPASGDPEQVYHVTARRLRDYGVETGKRALAIAVVKADLLTDVPWAADLCAGAVREWLVTAGLDNLVLAAERDFAEVRFFVVSSVLGTRPGHRMTPAAPFRWLLGRGGFPLGDDEKKAVGA
ncbi:hypothetical protein SAMN05421805_10343 [Saccharopolyspora antimicrobica]|uniref:Double-GTPase 2 domain-containing protein n=1 Tax=Saccharopolyspora antimicrobica TaxID=455193 RepID=A0A1I4WRZ2_9PSEU|nr:hypothetical protein [Saccharopolyspora antimicrobica]RKT82982.1 hypothetical protein ATL45_1247 [Saccharopolyspora antimicrobica]SFN16568.1 hypothetical protein SAMN05421805_10343 [Saccharopolyspora antimicrobica]